MGRRSLWLVLFLVAGLAGGGTSLMVGDAGAVEPEPASQHSVVSRAAVLDPLDIAVPDSSEAEIAAVTIQPGGTTGLRRYTGPALVWVVAGTASRHRLVDGACRSATVPSGVAYQVSPGEIDEIRNDGGVPLSLQTTSFAPAGGLWATSAPGTSGCGTPAAKGVTADVLTRTTITDEGRITTDGPSDVLIGRIVIPQGASAAGWHSHPAATLVSVEEGRFDVTAVVQGRCVQKQFLKGTGFVEPAGEVHDGRNDTAGATTVYYVGITSFAGPFVVPQAPPACQLAA